MLWGSLLQSLLALLDHDARDPEASSFPSQRKAGTRHDGGHECQQRHGRLLQEAAEDEDEDAVFSGYSAAYARLHNAAEADTSPLPGIHDLSRYLAESVAQFSKVNHSRLCRTTPSFERGLMTGKMLD